MKINYLLFLFFLMIAPPRNILGDNSFKGYQYKNFPVYIRDIEKNWKVLYTKDNLVLYSKIKCDKAPMAFRGVGIIQAPIGRVLQTLRNVETANEWTPNLVGKKVLKELSYLKAIVYNHNFVPWPASDRDTIIYSKMTLDKNRKVLWVKSYSVKHPDAPIYENKVRAWLYDSDFFFKALGPKVTFVDFSAHFDAKGWLPNWLVRFIQQDYPYKFLSSLEREAKKPTKQKLHPEFKRLIMELNKLEKN